MRHRESGPSNFRVTGRVSGGGTCLIALGATAEEAVVQAKLAAPEIRDALAACNRRLKGATLERFEISSGPERSRWRKVRGLPLYGRMGVLPEL